MDATKRCPRCQQDKQAADFHRNAARYDGLSPYCRACANEHGREERRLRRASLPSQEERDEARFWSKVLIAGADECWIWQGRVIGSGYGLFSQGSRAISAHRFAYQTAHGAIPEGLVIRHTCDVKLCQNPGHLLSGTQQDNVDDALRRGRLRTGAQHPAYGTPREQTHLFLHPEVVQGDNNARAKLRLVQRDEILRKWAGGRKMGGTSCEKLAAEYGVSPSAIRFLVKGKTWNY